MPKKPFGGTYLAKFSKKNCREFGGHAPWPPCIRLWYAAIMLDFLCWIFLSVLPFYLIVRTNCQRKVTVVEKADLYANTEIFYST